MTRVLALLGNDLPVAVGDHAAAGRPCVELATVHLRGHLRMAAILAPEQIAASNRLLDHAT